MRLSDVAVVLTIIVAIIAISTFLAGLWSPPGQKLTPTSTPPVTLTPTLTPTSTPPVTLTPTLTPTNNPPAAFVDSINPNPSRQKQSVTFTCHGDDPDSGDYITEYRWESSIDGFLSNQKTFSFSSLSLGSHQIILRVKDSHGQWSSEITRNLMVEAIEIPSTEINDTTPEPSITPTPTPTPETKTWHSVITFTDSDHKKSEPFTIKGDEWRINYTVNPVEGKTDHSIFSVHVYPENETIVAVSSWKCSFECCNGTEYIYDLVIAGNLK
jgi:hypothetical protein